MNILQEVKDILFPKKCYSCNQEGYFLCKNCLETIGIYKSACYVCKSDSNRFRVHTRCKEYILLDQVIVLSRYRDLHISKLIKDAKFYGKKDILEDFSKFLGDLMLSNIDDSKKNYIIVSVPMYFLRRFKRGYNQSDILAKHISHITGIPYYRQAISRTRNTRQQSKNTKEERLSNLENSFKINNKYRDKLDNKKVIIIDDVISTGATLNEVSNELKRVGAIEIIGACIASG